MTAVYFDISLCSRSVLCSHTTRLIETNEMVHLEIYEAFNAQAQSRSSVENKNAHKRAKLDDRNLPVGFHERKAAIVVAWRAHSQSS